MKNIANSLFPYALLLFFGHTNPALAQTERVSVVYINGIQNTLADTQATTEKIRKILNASRNHSDTNKKKGFFVDGVWNPIGYTGHTLTEGDLKQDLKELFLLKTAEELFAEHFTKLLSPFNSPRPNNKDAAKRVKQYLEEDMTPAGNSLVDTPDEQNDNVTDKDMEGAQGAARALVNWVKPFLTNSRRPVIVVAHSQGNLLANLAYASLATEFDDLSSRVRLVNVANTSEFSLNNLNFTHASDAALFNGKAGSTACEVAVGVENLEGMPTYKGWTRTPPKCPENNKCNFKIATATFEGVTGEIPNQSFTDVCLDHGMVDTYLSDATVENIDSQGVVFSPGAKRFRDRFEDFVYTAAESLAAAGLPQPTVSLTASPSAITAGQSATLSWTSENVASCTASDGWNGSMATSGTQGVSPTQTTTYTLTCTGTSGGSTQTSTTVTVNSPTNLPAPIPQSPANASSGVSTTPTFGWSTVSGASSYRIMIAASASSLPADAAADSCSNCINDTPTSNTYTSTALTAGQTYFWQVKARPPTSDTQHNFGNWSSVSNFNTAASGSANLPFRTARVSIDSTDNEQIGNNCPPRTDQQPTDCTLEDLTATTLTVSSTSADGRFVVFNSRAANLVANDSNGKNDCFVRDRDTDRNGVYDEAGKVKTVLVSVDTSGAQFSSDTNRCSISGDGRFVLFGSKLRDRDPDKNGIFDESSHATTLNIQADSMSHSGRFLVFASDNAILTSDSNNRSDVYVHDRDSDGNGIFDEPGTIRHALISGDISSSTNESERFSDLSISADGRSVAFSYSTLNPSTLASRNLVYVYDRDADRDGVYDQPGKTLIVQFDSGGQTKISADGRFVTYRNSDLQAYDRDTDRNGIFDETGGVRMSRISDGTKACVSGDGRFVGYQSGQDIVVMDRDRDENGIYDELNNTATISASAAPNGASGNGRSDIPYGCSISADGRFVSFPSEASDLVTNDTNGDRDFFVVNLRQAFQ